MSTETPEGPEKGPISWMARNGVAANLLMFVIIAAGIVGMFRTTQEVFPSFTLDIITVSIPYPGASPTEVEQGIVLAVEEAVRGLDGVKKVSSKSSEGVGTVSVELLLGADRQQGLADVKSAVDGITSFPEEALEPRVSLVSNRREVISLVISGDQDLETLHGLAEKVRTDLTTNPDVRVPVPVLGTYLPMTRPGEAVTQAEIFGIRPLEVSIEIPREAIEAHGLSLTNVAQQIRLQSQEIPGGAVKTEGGEILVRVDSRRRTAKDFADIELRGTATGARLRLGDVATIIDGYADTDQESFYNGRRAVRVTAYRVGNETPRGVAGTVRAYADKLRAELPENVSVDIWADDSIILDERIELLVRNGAMGLVLVFFVLALLLDLRLAFWVGLGIPISFMGTFFLMPAMDISINMVSLFAFIVTLGLVVDDAIIVGENVHEKTERGIPGMTAAIEGAQEMAVPVAFAVLTTCAAFAPMLFVPGVMGKIFRLMPVVVISVLVFSLVESFFVLPAHLGHTPAAFDLLGRWFGWVTRPIEWVRIRVSGGLDSFTHKLYRPILEVALRYRYVTAAAAVAAFLLTIGVIGSGLVPFRFFPKLEGDKLVATARYPYGTPAAKTAEVQRALEEGAFRAIDANGGRDILIGMFSRLGEGPIQGGPAGGAVDSGSHMVTVELFVVPTDQRDISAEELAFAWEEQLPSFPGLESLVINSSVGPGAGAAVDVQLIHAENDVLAAASNELTDVLRTYPSLTNIENAYSNGKPQLDYDLKPLASTMSLTAADLGNQVRAAFYGAEALREQRGRNEVKVMVRLPEDQRASEYDLEELRITTPAGRQVPLGYVADYERTQAPTSISRERGRRMVEVKAELAKGYASSREIIQSLEEEILPGLKEKYPGLQAEFAGAQREQSEAMGSLGWNFLLSAFVIYALLAVPFRSYLQPLIIMSAIPMGLVGAVGGHLVMGYELSMISSFGIVALAGVVVNDSLVLVDASNGYRAAGATPFEAVVMGGTRRMRPILLTSLTTFMGLAPMIAEPSVQARFLIPMAISLGFGVLFTTFVTLLLIPALYLILEDVIETVLSVFRLAPATPSAEVG
ncbi:MAG: efflux RND transporter permease subunit [Alphaproteobacteria bacterium]|nr:efflux RND transporter permease subunit [Alphaproteobacteria bacterium]